MSKTYRGRLITELLNLDRVDVAPEHQTGSAYVDYDYLNGTLIECFSEETGEIFQGDEGKEITEPLWDPLCTHLIRTCNGYIGKDYSWRMDVALWGSGSPKEVKADFYPLSRSGVARHRTGRFAGKRINIQESVNRKLKEEIANFVIGPGYVLIKKKMVGEHGESRDVDVPSWDQGKQGNLFGKGFDPGSGANVDREYMKRSAAKARTKTSKSPSGEVYEVAPGAAGTITEQKIRSACKKAGGEFRKLSIPLRTQMSTMLRGWMKEMLGVEDDLSQDFNDYGISAECKVKLLIAGEVEGANRPEISKFIQEEFVKVFKEDKDAFHRLAKRMNLLTEDEAEKLWGASKGPIKKGKAIATRVAIDSLFLHATKADARFKVNKALFKDLKDSKKKKGRSRNTIMRGKNPRVKKTNISPKRKTTKAGSNVRSVAKAHTGNSPVALRNLLNEVLPMEVAKRMNAPALRFRTGRFANSARVENVHVGPRGGTQIDYTYMRNPYETFEPGGKQGSTLRDPRRLIGGTLREIATGIIGSKFTVRRV